MPFGFQRLNERVSQPNARIGFIKPLPGATSGTAGEFLNRIAAQCYPIMQKHGILVMSLEEFPWNREFIGRNFNAGEVIQLVLRSRSGAWLPFRYVQMTMMHELAHCKQMNHSRAFWAVRNTHADEMRALWERGYTGEGLWGRGRRVENGEFCHVEMPMAQDLPEHTCGGAYRRSGRKRKRGRTGDAAGKLSYAEKKQRRILKKFGAGGLVLGDDEDTRVKLEDGKKRKGNPRVAASNRGRELRAAAALARSELTKKEKIKDEIDEDDDATDLEDEFGWPSTDDESTCVRRDGKDFVRVCDVDEEDDDVKREQEDMLNLRSIPTAPSRANLSTPAAASTTAQSRRVSGASSKPAPPKSIKQASAPCKKSATAPTLPKSEAKIHNARSEVHAAPPPPKHTKPLPSAEERAQNACPACSMSNDVSALLCAACSNVLHPSRTPNHWRCISLVCRAGVYVNMGDYGRCQICGAQKPG